MRVISLCLVVILVTFFLLSCGEVSEEYDDVIKIYLLDNYEMLNKYYEENFNVDEVLEKEIYLKGQDIIDSVSNDYEYEVVKNIRWAHTYYVKYCRALEKGDEEVIQKRKDIFLNKMEELNEIISKIN